MGKCQHRTVVYIPLNIAASYILNFISVFIASNCCVLVCPMIVIIIDTVSFFSSDGDSSTTPDRPPPQRSTTSGDIQNSAQGGPSPPQSPPRHAPSDSLVGRLEALVADFRESKLDALPANELFQAHGHVNNLLESIMAALKMKCHSPSMDHVDH